MTKSLTKSYAAKMYTPDTNGTIGSAARQHDSSSLETEIPTETAIKTALRMYDSDLYTIAIITQKTGVSKTLLYQALGLRSIESFDSRKKSEK